MEQLSLDLIPQGNPQRNFYNTVKLKGNDLIAADTKALTKKMQILKYFQENPDKKFTPLEVSEALKLHESTTRRSIHQLSHGVDAPLLMLDEQKQERYGLPNHLFKLK